MAHSPTASDNYTELLESRSMQSMSSDPTSPTSITAPCSHVATFPTEIWAEICTRLDIHALWSSIRPVSRMLFAEAEREIKRSRLPNLRFRWRFYYTEPEPTHQIQSLYAVKRLTHFSEDDQRVLFDVDDGFQSKPLDGPRPRLLVKTKETIKNQKQSIDDQHDDIVRQLKYKENSSIIVSRGFDRSIILAGSVRAVELPALEIDLYQSQISFNWRQFVAEWAREDERRRTYWQTLFQPTDALCAGGGRK